MLDAAQLLPGQRFPDFALPDGEGRVHRLGDYAGRPLVVYVYPKDDTPGCTREACDFRDRLALRERDVRVLGVSRDDAASHRAFSEKHRLNFPVLSDPDAALIRAVGAWGAQTRNGVASEGVLRQTFLMAPDDTVLKVWRDVDVTGHADQVLRELDVPTH